MGMSFIRTSGLSSFFVSLFVSLFRYVVVFPFVLSLLLCSVSFVC